VLAVAIDGAYGYNGAFAALRVGDAIIGAPDRAPSYPYNNWEHFGVEDGHYTYCFRPDQELIGQEIDVVILGFAEDMNAVQPEVWLTAWPAPARRIELTLHE
jgi:hypothetical protein